MVDVQVIRAREVPLGEPGAMAVRRTLPARGRRMVGAWCFVDHFGPVEVGRGGPAMDVAPHPHCGLATVSWLFGGEVEHRDSLGTHAVVRPGEVNLMTAGRGIAHSEVALESRSGALHGVQLWLALPGWAAGCEPRFEHHVPQIVQVAEGVLGAVFVGEAFGSVSPVRTETPALGAELRLFAGASVTLDLPGSFEVAVLLDQGTLTYAGQPLSVGDLAVVDALDPGLAEGEAGRGGPGGLGGLGGRGGLGGLGAAPRHTGLTLVAGAGGARVVLLGGPPFEEEIVMWWNFIGRSHEEIEGVRESWNSHQPRFGFVAGYVPGVEGGPSWLPAPELPKLRLKPR